MRVSTALGYRSLIRMRSPTRVKSVRWLAMSLPLCRPELVDAAMAVA
jgi:hypothetical protein